MDNVGNGTGNFGVTIQVMESPSGETYVAIGCQSGTLVQQFAIPIGFLDQFSENLMEAIRQAKELDLKERTGLTLPPNRGRFVGVDGKPLNVKR